MNFGSYGRMSAADCATLLARAVDAGINLIDTADVYSRTEAETLLGEALTGPLAGRRDDLVLVSKFHHPIDDHPAHRGSSRRWIHRAVEGSLRRLRTDHLDVYLAHRPDEDTPLDETVDALADLVRAGKIRHYGTSTFPTAQIVEAQWLGCARGARPAVEQPPYSVLARGIERDLLPVAQEYGIGTLVWSPLAGGWLCGRYREETRDPAWQRWKNPLRHDPSLPANQAKAAAVAQLEKIAAEAGLTLIQLAIAFVLEHPGVTSAVVGPRTVEHLDPQLAAAGTVLPREVLDAIDEVVPPGVTLNPGDLGYTAPALLRPELRRRNSR
ncbi:aldo/keto reductase [Pseudonocardia kujensis]|nr:aldo/keto reductase [Pseudonocardia kujensis]